MEEESRRRPIRSRWGVIAALAVTLLSLYPQFDMWLKLRYNWQGAYATMSNTGDEVTYASYINALINGRPRRNDPYTGHDNRGESIFSLQPIPAYILAMPARWIGLSASQIFILSVPFTAFLSTLAIFYLLALLTHDEVLAAVGALFILFLGSFVAWWTFRQFGLLFLRRYQPSVTFPLFFVLCAFTWKALTRRSLGAATLSGVTFALLVFSYFYLWTAAAAWLVCLAVLWLLSRSSEWRNLALRFIPIIIPASFALLIYGLLLTRRAQMPDKAIMLEKSHAPDLLQMPEIIGATVLLIIAIAVGKRYILWRTPAALFTISFAVLPFVLFNQQIITGLSLQPLHYALFISNYVSLLSVILGVHLLWPNRQQSQIYRYVLIFITLTALIGGVFQIWTTSSWQPFNLTHDKIAGLGKKLANIDLENKVEAQHKIVFATHNLINEFLPNYAPQAVLWGGHMYNSDISIDESRERYFQQLYYSGIKVDDLAKLLRGDDALARSSLFGPNRAYPQLKVNFQGITAEEVDRELLNYSNYVGSYDRQAALKNQLSYYVGYLSDKTDVSNLDHWYERDAGENIGPFILYRLKVKGR